MSFEEGSVSSVSSYSRVVLGGPTSVVSLAPLLLSDCLSQVMQLTLLSRDYRIFLVGHLEILSFPSFPNGQFKLPASLVEIRLRKKKRPIFIFLPFKKVIKYWFISLCRLLVGAPTAQTEQPGVTRGGSVFRCSTEIPDQCQSIPFDVTGQTNQIIA